MGTCVHFSRTLPSNSWWQNMAGWQVLSRPSAAEGGGRRPAFTGLAIQPYSATEVDGWQQAQPGVSKPGRSTPWRSYDDVMLLPLKVQCGLTRDMVCAWRCIRFDIFLPWGGA